MMWLRTSLRHVAGSVSTQCARCCCRTVLQRGVMRWCLKMVVDGAVLAATRAPNATDAFCGSQVDGVELVEYAGKHFLWQQFHV